MGRVLPHSLNTAVVKRALSGDAVNRATRFREIVDESNILDIPLLGVSVRQGKRAAHILGLVLEPHFEVTVRRAVVIGVRIAVGWRAQVAARLALARLVIIALTSRHMHDTDGLPIFNGCNGM